MYSPAPQVSFGPAGEAIAVWSLLDGSNVIVGTSSSRDGGETWGPVTNLSAAGQDGQSPQISIDDAGNAVAVWTFYDGVNYVVQGSSSNDGGATWAAAVDLSVTAPGVYNPQVSFDAAGHAIAIWALYDSGDYIIQTRSSSDGGATWSSIVDFSDFVQSGNNPQVGFDAFGNALAVWSGYNGSDYVVQARSSADAGATWGNVSNLSATGSDGYNPQLSFDASGNALAIWYLYEGTEYIIQSSALPAPALPDTGVSPAMTGTFAAIGAGLLAGGFAALLVVRRRLAGK